MRVSRFETHPFNTYYDRDGTRIYPFVVEIHARGTSQWGFVSRDVALAKLTAFMMVYPTARVEEAVDTDVCDNVTVTYFRLTPPET